MDCFLPVKAESQRLPNKNFLPIPELGISLTTLKLTQLANCHSITRIIVSTDDPSKLEDHVPDNAHHLCEIVKRPKLLASPNTTIRDLARHASEICESEFIIWTHVTSPGLSGQDYENAIRELLAKQKEGYDSAISLTKLQNFVFNKNLEPENFISIKGDWPSTQSLEIRFEVTSGIFLARRKTLETGRRVGERPLAIFLNRVQAIDIDYPEDFECLGRLKLLVNEDTW